jgi:hypothetical protein
MKKAIFVIICLALIAGITSCDLAGPTDTDTDTDTDTELGIVGEWLTDQTYEMYTDNIPIDTWTVIVNATFTANADGTYSTSGTNQFPPALPVAIESTGTYAYDEEAGMLVMTELTATNDDVSRALAVRTYRCEVTDTTNDYDLSVRRAGGVGTC